jgi:hypothetical protein
MKIKKNVKGKEVEVEEESVVGGEEEAVSSSAEVTAQAEEVVEAPKAVPQVKAAPVAVAAQPVVAIPVKKEDYVRVAITKDLDPAPKVGSYDFRTHHTPKLKIGQHLNVPLHVALHLKDCGAAVIAN